MISMRVGFRSNCPISAGNCKEGCLEGCVYAEEQWIREREKKIVELTLCVKQAAAKLEEIEKKEKEGMSSKGGGRRSSC